MVTSLLNNPCVRNCPERSPGCCCEKRKAWLGKHRELKRRQRIEAILAGYQHDAKHDSKNRHKERHDWRHP